MDVESSDPVLVRGRTSTCVFGQVLGSPPQTTVPEPASLLLLGTGLAGVVGAARRRAAAGGD